MPNEPLIEPAEEPEVIRSRDPEDYNNPIYEDDVDYDFYASCWFGCK